MKTRLFLLLFFAANFLQAQQLNYTPYSRFGIGDLIFQGNVRNISMGRTSLASISMFHINKVNPASYGFLKPNNVIFEVALFDKFSKFENQDSYQYTNLSNIRTIYGGFPITYWWHLATGLLPFSSTGYRVEYTDSISASGIGTKYTNIYEGYGGINEFFIGNSFSYKRMLHAGINVSYIFGSANHIVRTNINEIYNNFISSTINERRSIFRGFKYEFGFIFTDTLLHNKEDNSSIFNFAIGGIYSNKQNIKSLNTQYIGRSVRLLNRTHLDTFYFDTLGIEKITIPQTFGLGASVKLFEKLEIQGDYIYSKWGGLTYFGQNNFVDSKFMGIGMEYCTQPISTNYWKTIRYRLGAYKFDKYITFNNKQITEKALTFGIAMPFKKMLFNLGFVIGTQGSYDTGLKENFYEVHLNFTLYDLWFVKRKFL